VKARKRRAAAGAGDPAIKALEKALQESLSTRVTVRGGRKGRGSIEITFHGLADLDRLVEILTGRSAAELVG
jgi:hypothetical protein